MMIFFDVLQNFLTNHHVHPSIHHHNLVQGGMSDVALHHLGVGIAVGLGNGFFAESGYHLVRCPCIPLNLISIDG